MSSQEQAMINRALFFTLLKSDLFVQGMNAKQRAGLNAILDRWNSHLGSWNASADLRNLAYILATVHHETAQTMQPIKERGGAAYLHKNYDINGNRPNLARINGNTTPGDGMRYAGRGFVQLTWKSNYERAGERLGIDLVGNPDRAMELAVATDILFAGMGEGWFTGKKLEDYFSSTKTDWINARRIINGLDKASLIAELAKTYFLLLRNASNVPSSGSDLLPKKKSIKLPELRASTVLPPQRLPPRPAKASR